MREEYEETRASVQAAMRPTAGPPGVSRWLCDRTSSWSCGVRRRT